MLFILQRLEADLQFSAFDGIFFLGFLAKRKVEDQIIGAMSQAYCRFKLILCWSHYTKCSLRVMNRILY